jgi:hypothetical protein
MEWFLMVFFCLKFLFFVLFSSDDDLLYTDFVEETLALNEGGLDLSRRASERVLLV